MDAGAFAATSPSVFVQNEVAEGMETAHIDHHVSFVHFDDMGSGFLVFGAGLQPRYVPDKTIFPDSCRFTGSGCYWIFQSIAFLL